MVEFRNDPSMDEILASIKRIIAEDGATAVATATAPRAPAPIEDRAAPDMAEPDCDPDSEEDEVLELTEALAPADPVAPAEQEPLILSQDAAAATQTALSSLSTLLLKPKPGEQTLDTLVRDMLRPMLKDWLDSNLPRMVEDMVRREIKRITGQS